MEKKFDKLESKIDEKFDAISEQLYQMNTTLTKNTVVLEEHQRRSLANEQAVKLLETALVPIEKHIYLVSIVGKIVLVLASSSLGLWIIQEAFKLSKR